MRLQNEIEGLNEALREANKKCTEYVHRIDELEVDNKRLSERVKTLVIEKTNRAAIAEKVSDPKEDIETKNFDMETLQLLNKITELEEENDRLKVRIDDMEADELLGDSCDVGKAIDNENTEELIEENKILSERISELAVRNTEVEKLLEKSGVTRDDKKSLIKDMKRVISAIMTYDED